MNWLLAAAVFAVCAVASGIATGIALRYLTARQILDHPIERSSHAAPTPRGGGLAVIGILVGAWAAIGTIGGGDIVEIGVVCLAALLLAGISWIDDLRSLSARSRLAAQAVCVAAALLVTPLGAVERLGPWMSPALIVLALGWIWFVNLFNFMDGIDGITGVETVSIGTGAVVVAAVAGLAGPLPLFGIAAAAAAAGFLCWNWSPARIFLGDVGSVPLGFLLGWLLLKLAVAGLWAPALILPLYYLADATVTLLRRVGRGEKPWQAHKEHFYQRAEQAGRGHAQVSGLILAVNLLLVLLAAVSITYPAAALVGAGLFVAVLLWRFSRAEDGAEGSV